MTPLEKVLGGALVVVLIICVVLGVQKTNIELEIGAAEFKENEIREALIKTYDNHIVGLEEIISTLQTERDSLRNEKSKIRTVTITEIDSIRALPFTGKRVFWTTQTARIDSIRERYTSSN